ncbi:hypothetical protein [Proteiniphilum sp. X52]|uniref:hypothetical protein n=1 Tax=Proteiniphilum sp. X52 TaxID=2382159 RepID=UPI000F09B224|nr:hypothetical protein [Proteiniphilum sp. X52]RNC64108.1 hypothetical protein D7D25_12850 [Proteiniphilum sp. X52]
MQKYYENKKTLTPILYLWYLEQLENRNTSSLFRCDWLSKVCTFVWYLEQLDLKRKHHLYSTYLYQEAGAVSQVRTFTAGAKYQLN